MSDIHTFEPLWSEWYIVKRLGQGSFGTVYLAQKSEFGKKYYSAIKHIKIPVDDHAADELYSETDATRRQYYDDMLNILMQEIEINYRLKGNTNIVSYEEHKVFPRKNELGYDVFIKMELLTSLTDHIKNASVAMGDVVRLGVDICTALTVLQQERIVHRDIKPANIFVHSGGHYKLGDFGVARTLEKTVSSMSVKGTVAYMSPEVRQGGDGDYRVDVYSLGLVLYRLLNGNRAPFLPMPPASITYNSDMQAHKRRLQGEKLPAPTMADERLSNIILKACAYRPEDRYSDAAHFRSALTEYETFASPDLLKLVVLGEKFKQSEIRIPEFVPDLKPEPGHPEPEPLEPETSQPAADERTGTVFILKDSNLGRAVDDGTIGIFQGIENPQPLEDLPEPTEFDSMPELEPTEFEVKPEPEPTELEMKPEPESTELEVEPEPGPVEPGPPKPERTPPHLPIDGKTKRTPIIGAAFAVAVLLLALLMVVLLPKDSDTVDTPPPASSAVTEPSPTPTVTPTEKPAVVLADEDLETYIRKQLKLAPEDEITLERLEQISELRIGADTGFTVRTLEDLSLLPNLKILDIKGQQPDSFKPITELKGLINLNLGGCDLRDDRVLDRLPAGIQNLALNDTGLTSLQFASRLEQLSYLNISGNSVSDLTPLASLTQLSYLDADGNPISDWSAVENVPVVIPGPQPTEQPSSSPTLTVRPSQPPSTTPTPAPSTPTPVLVSGISLSQASAILEIGGGFTLTATVVPANAANASVSWSSSNPGVATVNASGRVTATGSGTAVITASCGGYSAYCTVSVG